MASACTVIRRSISTTAVRDGKRNIRNFLLYNKSGTRLERQQRAKLPDALVDARGVRMTCVRKGDKLINIKEKIPEIVVPNLEGFKLKPYVSYQARNIERREFTAKDLFDIVYADKIRNDFKAGQLKPNGDPVNPSEYELLTPEEARIRAEQTGTDIFTEELKREA